MFTERSTPHCFDVSSIFSGTQFSDTRLAVNPSDISSVLNQLSFVSESQVDILGSSLNAATVWNAINRSFAFLGDCYSKNHKAVRGILGVEVATGAYWLFRTGVGVRYRNQPIEIARVETRESVQIEDISEWEHRLKTCDDLLPTLRGAITQKVTEYDTRLPDAQIDAINTLRDVLQRNSSDAIPYLTRTQFLEALLSSGLAVQLTSSAWRGALARERNFSIIERLAFNDGECLLCDTQSKVRLTLFIVRGSELGLGANATYISPRDMSQEDKVVCVAVRPAVCPDEVRECVEALYNLYAVLRTFPVSSVERPEHFSLSVPEPELPSIDFCVVRDFGDSLLRTHNGSQIFHPCVAVSRVSGKTCVAMRSKPTVVPLFWVQTLSDAWRICALCHFLPFDMFKERPRRTWNMCVGIFRSAGIPYPADFSGWKNTEALRGIYEAREAIVRGERDGYRCAVGTQEIFDLALKQPPT
jgi:hypothetical protein